MIELRQQLKHATEITEELKAKYEALTEQLEKQTELSQALEVQKELLGRFYKPGDTELYEKLGELYEKAGDESLKTYVNGAEVAMDVAPFIEKGRALVPVRAISASLKADVKWDGENRTVEVVRGETKITLYLDSNEADVNGTKVKLETAPVLKNGRVFLPLRFIGEQLNAKVGYQEEGDLIIIEDGQPDGTTGTEAGQPDGTAGTEAGQQDGTTSTEAGQQDGTASGDAAGEQQAALPASNETVTP
ncbi:copper amine oxidase N-terminal domain-containing protein [Brevibacillus choshinensis]|uniref:Copper amine oxidase N-terminal domain-containing protein n=2 Tax=Brevibacillus choshinensis TaxID=54911 RepID=A0ABX7FYB5_BRECH|nr:copper amine oxidase N-terminal domain-containing protein [Brevibacillus choshinensis]